MFRLTLQLVALVASCQLTIGGYTPASYYPSLYPTLVQQPLYQPSFVRPVTTIQVPQKQPLQLRPPSRPAIALPNTRPPVVAIHAEQQQPIQGISAPVSSNQGIPVVAVQAEQPQNQRPNIPLSPPYPTQPQVVAIQAQQQNQFQAIPVSALRPSQQVIPVVAQSPVRKIVLPYPTEIATLPSYSFGYAVNDPTTGDQKSHEEKRTGNNVVGRYTVVEPDGTLRTVTYTAGPEGFNAVVERTPGYAPPNAPVKVIAVAKPVIASPAIAVKPVQAAPVYPAGFHFGG